MKKNSINFFTLITTIAIASTALSGCSSVKGWMSMHDNGSLEYQNSELLAPIQIPAEKQTQVFTPLYTTIDLGKSSIKMTNTFGKQYKLPTPQKAVQ